MLDVLAQSLLDDDYTILLVFITIVVMGLLLFIGQILNCLLYTSDAADE